MRLRSDHTTVNVIQNEHDLLSAVINGMLHFVREIDKGQKAPDLKVFRAMLFYISEYPERIHHPKEDTYLFEPLRKHTDSVSETLDELEAQHINGEAQVRMLEHALARYEFGGDRSFAQFKEKVEEYATFYFNHMRMEEQIVLPAAEKLLTAEEWDACDRAFADNNDPLADKDLKGRFEDLFTLIVTITPAPIGVGAPA